MWLVGLPAVQSLLHSCVYKMHHAHGCWGLAGTSRSLSVVPQLRCCA